MQGMVIDGRMVLSEADIERHQADALLQCRKAKQNLNLLLATADQMSKRFFHVAKLLADLKTSDSWLHGPAVDLLQLPEMEYGDSLSLTAIKGLANAVILAQKQVADALQHARNLGVNE
jgi:hypothetical protein